MVSLFAKFGRFILVGGVATATQYLILIILVEWFKSPVVLSSAIGFALSALVSYILNYKFTFQSTASRMSSLPKFIVTATAGLAINTAIMAGLVEQLAVQYMLAQIGATCITLIWNFSINAAWSFR